MERVCLLQHLIQGELAIP
jgi:hypothetical protein